MILKLTLVAFALGMAMPHAKAQDNSIRIASGPKGGTYDLMVNQLAAACKQDILIVNALTAGSLENIDALLGNISTIKVNAAMAQLDALKYKANTEDGMNRLRTLVNLYPESVHIVALNKTYSVPKAGMDKAMVWKDAQTYTLNTLADLEGRRIGAAGGSFVTAKSMQFNGQFGYKVQEYETNDKALAALNAGEVEAVMLVGGHPLPTVAGLDKAKYKLIQLGDDAAKKVEAIYLKNKISYPNLGVSGMATVYTTSALVVSDTKSPKMLANYAALRACLFKELPGLQESGHKQWRNVADDQMTNPDARGRWAWLDLPLPSPAATAPVAAPTAPPPAATPGKRAKG